jgi:hypothetical protein
MELAFHNRESIDREPAFRPLDAQERGRLGAGRRTRLAHAAQREMRGKRTVGPSEAFAAERLFEARGQQPKRGSAFRQSYP